MRSSTSKLIDGKEIAQMAEPAPLAGMTSDRRQELKEAVCDAILERTRRVVSGVGEHGAVILGDRPSRVLSSGFVLPRMVGDDDESSDIRIASHGMDVRLRGGEGEVVVRTEMAVYVRGLPTSDELFARGGRLLPKADFSPGANQARKAAIAARVEAEVPRGISRKEATPLREAIVRRVTEAMGVVVPANAQLASGDDRDIGEEAGANVPPPDAAGGRLRIPDAISKRYDIPEKWIRLAVAVPELTLPLPCDPASWERLAATHAIGMIAAVRAAFDAWLATPQGQDTAWRRCRPPSEAFWEPTRWDAFLAVVRGQPIDPDAIAPPVEASLLAQALEEPIAPGCYSVRFALDNMREADEDRECGLFGVSVTVGVPEGCLIPLSLERVRRSYHLAGFLTMPAIGVNGGVDDLGSENGLRWLRSTWMPRYVLPRMATRDLPGLPTAYSHLARAETDLGHMLRLADELDAWATRLERDGPPVDPDVSGSAADEHAQRVRFQDDLASWRSEAARVRRGGELLVRSQAAWQADPVAPGSIPYRAWILTNEAFSRANPAGPGAPAPGWRLFQAAFVLAHVPTLASRVPGFEDQFDADFDEEKASLLYMSTGGGKTEAFFGIVLFALFLDRLRGKRRGVTAMMHYPLRLLTVQQAQRLSKLLAKAEMVRRGAELAGAAFEIGFWVGGSNTPNRTEGSPGRLSEGLECIPEWNSQRGRDEAALRVGDTPADRAYASAWASWNKLPSCPFCGADTGLRIFPVRRNALGIVCQGSACDWNRAHDATPGARREPLPFWVADSDIYRRAPSIMLGTIDKLALLGQHTSTINQIAGMFGMARTIAGGPDGLLEMTRPDEVLEAGAELVAPAWSGGAEVFHDPFPSLIVQDEMHLLEESLGTFGGIFETGLLAWMRRLAPLLAHRASRWPGVPDSPRLPHIVGATATAADAEKHVRAIYQRRVVQFPHPGPGLNEGFYVQLSRFAAGGEAEQARAALQTPRGREAVAPWGRVYASLMTNGRRHTVTTLAVLAAHAATVTRWQRDLSSADPAWRARAALEMEQSVSDAPWSGRRRSAIRFADNSGRHDALAALVDLHRIMLTYVTNKKGGDQILSALDGEAHEAHAAMGGDYELSEFKTTLISGGVDIGTIQTVIRQASEAFDPMADDIASALRGIVATSAISHGVDVEAFNAMCFAGMPADVAEYIQASSRVGRTHVGFSLLVPTPQTRRDRFVVEVHESFHRLLERMIAPPSVERWADRAIERTVPSLLQTWLAGVRYQERFAAAAADHKSSVPTPDTVERVERILGEPGALEDCVAFVRDAVGVNIPAPLGGPNSPEHYRNLLLRELERIRNTLTGTDYSGLLSKFWSNPHTNLKRPMTSLRDVDEAGSIVASGMAGGQRVSAESVADAMAFLRNRGAGRTRRGASSEMDAE